MKRMMAVISILVFILVGCTQKTDGNSNQKNVGNSENIIKDQHREPIKEFTIDPKKFHFVVDWLTDTQIVYVEKDDDIYIVKTFDVTTGEMITLYEEEAIIVDVLIHPSKKELLLHTTTNSTSAKVKIISLEGAVLDEITIASSELAIEWNDVDPTLVLLTAFYEDWTFDVFLYDGEKELFDLIALESPFPQWLGTDEIAAVHEIDGSLAGNKLLLYDHETGKRKQANIEDIIYFETYKDSLLTVQLDQEKNAVYSILDKDETIVSSWTMPAVSDYSEWFFPEITWLSSSTVIVPSAEKSGQLDDVLETYKLVLVTDGQQEVLFEDIVPGSLSCSPNGEKCLTGDSKEILLDVKTFKETKWLFWPN